VRIYDKVKHYYRAIDHLLELCHKAGILHRKPTKETIQAMSTVCTAQRRHSDYYLRKLHDLDLQYRKGGEEAAEALSSFTSEWDQCKRGQDYAAEWIGQQDWATDFAIGYAIAGTLLLSLRFPPYQRIEWLECGLRAARRKGQLSIEAEILGQLGSASDALGDWDGSIRLYRESLEKARVLKDREREGRTLGNLGLVYMMVGDHNQAKINLEKALAIAREVGDRQAEGRHLGSLGLISSGYNSIAYFDQALEIARASRDRDGEISHLGCLGVAWLQNGENLANIRENLANMEALMNHPNILMRNTRPDGSLPEGLSARFARLRLESPYASPLQRAANYFQEAVIIAREIGDSRAEARHLGNLGEVQSQEGKIDKALNCYKEALAISEQIGDRQNQVKQLENMKSAYRVLHHNDEARRIEARLKEISSEGATKNILEKEEIAKYWSEYYSIHVGE
jgi:tetratricopeptide (TPR) repeat protein